MPIMDAESQYTPQGMQTTARVGGFGMQGLDPNGMSGQLMALLNPALAFKQQMAQQQMKLAQNRDDREGSELQFNQDMARKQMLQALQDREQSGLDAQQARIRASRDAGQQRFQARRDAAYEQEVNAEDVYGQTVGGMNSMPGFTPGVGSAGAHGFGFAGKRKANSGFGRTGGGSMVGGGSGTPMDKPLNNSLQEMADRNRAIDSSVEDDGFRADPSTGYAPSYSRDFSKSAIKR